MPVGILAVGGHVPASVITNEQIATWTGVTSEWIVDRTGILERRYADERTPTSHLARAAVDDLSATYPSALRNLGLVVLATCTPDQPVPATAPVLADALGYPGVPAFDLNAVCSGFLYALVLASSFVETANLQSALVVGADKLSSITSKRDRKTVSLFGDGAGAVVLGPVPPGYGLLASALTANGSGHGFVEVIGGGSREPLTPDSLGRGDNLIRMDGKSVREYAAEALPRVIDEALLGAGVKREAVDRWILHQANPRMLGDLAEIIGIDPRKIPLTAPMWGNTSAASVPTTLWHSNRTAPLVRGNLVAFAALGAGMTAGAAVMRWY